MMPTIRVRHGKSSIPPATVMIAAVAGLFIWGCSSARFNTYYNANKNFKEALQLSKSRSKTAPPSGPEIAKLDKCLEKCGVIIARHSESSLVDDALFLMGRALEQKQEYGTAAEKFSELRAYFPASPYVNASYFLEARSRVELEQWAQAQSLLEADLSQSEDWTIWQERSALLLAQIAAWNDDCATALGRIETLIQRTERREVTGQAYLTMGRCLRSREEYDEAVGAFDKAYENSADREQRFEAQVEKGETLALMGRGDEALTTFKELESLARADSELAQVGLSVGRSLLAIGKTQEAEDAWRTVILAYPRENASKRARMELASMLETESRDFAAALIEYEELAKQGRPRLLVEKASRRAKALKEIQQLTVELSDSTLNHGSNLINLADIYYFRLQIADSAVMYYRRAHSEYPDSSWAPRALFVEAWILEGMADSVHTSTSRQLHDQLVLDYPDSPQARAILAGRGELAEDEGGLSHAAALYRSGELLWLEDENDEIALEIFTSLVDSFSQSPEAPKALLACAWISSESLHDSSETRIFLERLVDEYPGTDAARQATAVLGKAAGIAKLPYDTPPVVVNIDTVRCEEIAPVDSLHRLGIVRVRVLVSAAGSAKTVELVKGTTSLICDDSAMQAARTADFSPARKDTAAVEAWLEMDVPFLPVMEAQSDSTQTG